jgi:VRR-NUC domain-containing protein
MSIARRVRRYRPDPEALATMAWQHPWTPTEAEFTDLFLQIADRSGWTPRYHVYDARRSAPGFPDWVLVNKRQRRILFVELKGFGGIASVDQREFLTAINDAGGEGYLVGTTGDMAQDMAKIADLLQRRPAA